MKKFFSLVILFVSIAFNSYSQEKPVSVEDSSTASEAIRLSKTMVLIRRADSVHVADSLQKQMLKLQLEELSSRENKKRGELEEKLNSLQVSDSLKKVALKTEIASLKLTTQGFPVAPYKDTIFYVYTKIGSVSPLERSKIINERLKDLYTHFLVSSDSLKITDYGQTVDITYLDRTVISVTELDAFWMEQPKQVIANDYKTRIIKDIEFYKEETSFFKKVKLLAYTILVIAGLILLIYLINRLFKKKIDTWIISKKDVVFTGFRFKNYEFLDSNKQTDVILFVSKAVKIFLIIFVFYITLPLIFIIFPPTQRLAEILFGYVFTPVKSILLGFVNYIPNLFTIVVIVTITRYILRFLRYLTLEIEYGRLHIQGFYSDWARPTYNIVKVIVYAFMFITIFPYLPGSDSAIFKGVSVFLGIIFSLGSSSVIGNLVAGLVMTYMRPFIIGDRIKINDVVGDVVEKTAFVTRVRTPKKEFVTIPNSLVLASNVINYSTSRDQGGIVLHTTITIGYDVPWRQVHELLISAALKTEYVMKEPKPFILQTSLDDFYVSYQLNAYSNEPNKQPSTYSELHQNIQDAFNEAGVEIMSPHYRAPRDGNQTTIPAEYLPEGYKAPSFRFSREDENKKGDQ